MSANRMLTVDADKCIGCRACTNVCPAGLISCKDEERLRLIRFESACAEECTRCADACPERAIVLEPVDRDFPAGSSDRDFFTLEFKLAGCADCGKPFIPERMVGWLRGALSRNLDPEKITWTDTCPACRRIHEAGHVAVRGLMTR